MVIGLGLVFAVNGHYAWWYGPEQDSMPWWTARKLFWFSGEWWVNSNIAFFLGLLFAFKEDKINAFFRKLYFVKLPVLLALYIGAVRLSIYGQSRFGYWTEFDKEGPRIGDKIITFFMQMPQAALFVILIYVVFMKYHFNNPVLKFFGNYSYETYMMNYLPVLLFLFMRNNMSGVTLRVFYTIAVFVVTIVSALIYKEINKPFIKIFTPNAKKN